MIKTRPCLFKNTLDFIKKPYFTPNAINQNIPKSSYI